MIEGSPRLTVEYTYKPNSHFQLFRMNGKGFVLISQALTKPRVSINLPEYNIVILAPMSYPNGISIRADSVIILNKVTATQGKVEVFATGKLLSLIDNPVDAKMGCTLIGNPKIPNPLSPEELEEILDNFQEGFDDPDSEGSILDGLIGCVKGQLKSLDPEAVQEYLGIPSDYVFDEDSQEDLEWKEIGDQRNLATPKPPITTKTDPDYEKRFAAVQKLLSTSQPEIDMTSLKTELAQLDDENKSLLEEKKQHEQKIRDLRNTEKQVQQLLQSYNEKLSNK